MCGRFRAPFQGGAGMGDCNSDAIALVDRFGSFVVLTLMLPTHLAEVAAGVVVELRRACETAGSDSAVAELAGTLVGLLDGAEVVTSKNGVWSSSIHA